MQTPFLGAIINTTQAVLEKVQVSFLGRGVIDIELTYSLDRYQTQRGLCSAFGTSPQIVDRDCDPSYHIRYRWRNAYRGAESCREIHRVLSLSVVNSL
jgi:hypothetical protein